MKDLFTILSNLEKDEHIHLGRLLLLIYTFSGDKNSFEIEGLTKLAKLDFFLRYPTYLERALEDGKKKMIKSPPKDYERKSVEAKMIRFRYGPWDFRYRRFINILIGMGVIYMRKEKRSYYLGITEKGVSVAKQLEQTEELGDIVERSKMIKTNFNYSGSHLMNLIYRVFPEIVSLKYGKEIL